MSEFTTDIVADIFRLIVNPEQVIHRDLPSSSANLSNPTPASSTNNATKKVQCLDISQLLQDKKIVDNNTVDDLLGKLQEIVFERIMIEDFAQFDVKTLTFNTKCPDSEFIPNDAQILRYLYGCYYRLQAYKFTNDIEKGVSDVIMNLVFLYLTEPIVFPDNDKRCKKGAPAPLLVNLVTNYHNRVDLHNDIIRNFVAKIDGLSVTNEDAFMEHIVTPTYARITQRFIQIAIDDSQLTDLFSICRVFFQHDNLAQKLLQKSLPSKDASLLFESTLLGTMIGVSHLPRPSNVQISFFNNIRFGDGDHKFTENQLGVRLQIVTQEMHKLFHGLLKNNQTRNSTLSWMGRCLHTFKDRRKLWNNQVLMATTPISFSDGFLLNFMAVMLLLSEPFTGPYNLDSITNTSFRANNRMLKIDPLYCKWSKSSPQNSAVHFLGLSEETFLIRTSDKPGGQDDGEGAGASYQPNFISECFYGAHLAFTYGFRSVYERFFKLAQTITELQQAYASVLAESHASGSTSDQSDIIRQQADASITQFYNLKAAMMAPSRIAMQMHFCIATASYLNHLVMCKDYSEATSSTEFKTVTLESLRNKTFNRSCLEYMPEMLIENILDCFIFIKNFKEAALAQATNMLEPLMTLIITFMGDSSLMQNPHLRARFAEVLECMMPRQHSLQHAPAYLGCAELFDMHPLIEQLVPSLVNVFVSIEMTGEGVQFEQKFSYRRPMYVVFEYLWEKQNHRNIFIQLATEAEENINSARPPLFLRFVNLLMNDAIFLLDEALSYMNQLKEAEGRKKSAEWQRLTPQQRAQAESTYTHIGRLARFHNVLSMSTIGTLTWLTSEIKGIFCHPTLVDRIANMLNYFLEHLVGPKKSKFNVTDKNDYEFRPKKILGKICQIYIHLGESDNNSKFREFCTAVSSDGRSYSEILLPLATHILMRTGMSALATQFDKLSRSVKDIAVQNQMDEISTDDIPDTFLDPIMSTIMTDPVLLPSSKIIVDRSTIARHLLSDQTDPFNRSPLSMEDVIPEVDLRNQIETFLSEKRQARRNQEN